MDRTGNTTGKGQIKRHRRNGTERVDKEMESVGK